MNLYCVKCSKFTKYNSIKIKHKIAGKINIYCCCIGYGFRKFETISTEQLSDLLKV